MLSSLAGLKSCFVSRQSGRMCSSRYGPLTGDPNRTEVPSELPGQTAPPWKRAELLAGISACVTLQTGTLSANI